MKLFGSFYNAFSSRLRRTCLPQLNTFYLWCKHLRRGSELEERDGCWPEIMRRIGQTMWEAFLPPCITSAVSGPREEFGSSTVKIEGMNDARDQKWKEKSASKSEQILTWLHCILRFGYWVNFIAAARLALGFKTQSLLYGSFWLFYLPLVMTYPSALATVQFTFLCKEPFYLMAQLLSSRRVKSSYFCCLPGGTLRQLPP